MPFRVRFRGRRVERRLQELDADYARRIAAAIDDLGRNPRPVGSARLRGSRGLHRIRVGNYRVIYSIDYTDRVVTIEEILPRNERTYRGLS